MDAEHRVDGQEGTSGTAPEGGSSSSEPAEGGQGGGSPGEHHAEGVPSGEHHGEGGQSGEHHGEGGQSGAPPDSERYAEGGQPGVHQGADDPRGAHRAERGDPPGEEHDGGKHRAEEGHQGEPHPGDEQRVEGGHQGEQHPGGEQHGGDQHGGEHRTGEVQQGGQHGGDQHLEGIQQGEQHGDDQRAEGCEPAREAGAPSEDGEAPAEGASQDGFAQDEESQVSGSTEDVSEHEGDEGGEMPEGLSAPEERLAGRVTLVLMPLEKLQDENAFRLRPEGDVSGLATDIARLGQLFPVDVRPAGEDRYQLVCGFRRVAALRFLKRDAVQARVHANLSDEDALLMSLAEAIHATPVEPEVLEAKRDQLESQGRLSAAVRDMLEKALATEDTLAPEGVEEEIDADELAGEVSQRLGAINQDLSLLADVFAALDESRKAELLMQLRYSSQLVAYLEDL